MDTHSITCTHYLTQRIGPYILEEQLGHGGFGCTFTAHHVDAPHHIVAVKLLKEGYLRSTRELSRFRREALLHEQLSHPHIVRVENVAVKRSVPYIAMEYLPRGTLQDWLRRLTTSRRLSLRNTLDIINQVGRALMYLHERGIVHCDLKPSNIGFDNQGSVKLLDFGIALYLGHERRVEGEKLGSLLYMAPEQLRGWVCRESDQFVLAALTYELLTGSHPFGASTNTGERYDALCTQQLVPVRYYNPSVPDWLHLVLSKAMHPSPTKRYPNIAAFIAALNGSAVHTRPEPTREDTFRYFIQLGNSYYSRHQFEQALGAYQRALQIDTTSAVAHCNKGASLYRLGRYAAALTSFKKALQHDRFYAKAAYWKYTCLQQLGYLDEAQEAFRLARRLGYSPRENTPTS